MSSKFARTITLSFSKSPLKLDSLVIAEGDKELMRPKIALGPKSPSAGGKLSHRDICILALLLSKVTGECEFSISRIPKNVWGRFYDQLRRNDSKAPPSISKVFGDYFEDFFIMPTMGATEIHLRPAVDSRISILFDGQTVDDNKDVRLASAVATYRKYCGDGTSASSLVPDPTRRKLLQKSASIFFGVKFPEPFACLAGKMVLHKKWDDLCRLLSKDKGRDSFLILSDEVRSLNGSIASPDALMDIQERYTEFNVEYRHVDECMERLLSSKAGEDLEDYLKEFVDPDPGKNLRAVGPLLNQWSRELAHQSPGHHRATNTRLVVCKNLEEVHRKCAALYPIAVRLRDKCRKDLQEMLEELQ